MSRNLDSFIVIDADISLFPKFYQKFFLSHFSVDSLRIVVIVVSFSIIQKSCSLRIGIVTFPLIVKRTIIIKIVRSVILAIIVRVEIVSRVAVVLLLRLWPKVRSLLS